MSDELIVGNGRVYADTLLGGVGQLFVFGLERIAPTTDIRLPRNGDTLGGTTTLDVFASDNVSVTTVEFQLTGGSHPNTIIATATHTKYGWIAEWDTTSVPNGTYSLQSVATDPAGNQAQSPDVTVNVHN